MFQNGKSGDFSDRSGGRKLIYFTQYQKGDTNNPYQFFQSLDVITILYKRYVENQLVCILILSTAVKSLEAKNENLGYCSGCCRSGPGNQIMFLKFGII